MIRLALFAAARNAEGRYALEGAQLTIGPDGARLIATDGHRLMCVTRRDLIRDEPVTLLIPRHSLHLVSKVFVAEHDILFSRDEHRLFWRQGGRLLSSVQLEGQYPDCEALLTQEFANTLTVESHVFRAVIQRMSVLGNDSNGGDFGHIKFHFTPSGEAAGYEMQCRDPQGSEGREQFEPTSAAAEQAVTISFNGRFLAEFAKTMPDAPVTIGYNDDRNSVALWLTMGDGYEVRYIVMPCVD
jgi:DNA polymerase-3 subunit beta